MVKRVGQLFESVIARDNLRLAAAKALRGKRGSPEARDFARDLEANLLRLSQELLSGEFIFGRFRQFVIHDPKERLITAPIFEERVVHHALMNVCERHFEKWLIDDTFACRVGRGRLTALDRAAEFARRRRFFLKADIRKYFDSISHSRLKALLRRRFKDDDLLRVFERVIESFRGEIGAGLPIGSLLSQHFANLYLAPLDRFVKEKLRVQGYVRYMDDFALWGDSTVDLSNRFKLISTFCENELGLSFKANANVNRSSRGMDFLGCRVFHNRLVLNRRSKTRFRRKVGRLETAYVAGAIDERELQRRVDSLLAFTRTRGLNGFQFRRQTLRLSLANVE